MVVANYCSCCLVNFHSFHGGVEMEVGGGLVLQVHQLDLCHLFYVGICKLSLENLKWRLHFWKLT